MEWSGDAVVLGTRRHGESSVILEVMTPDRGRHLGLVRGGRSRKLQATLQPGNSLRVTWRARLDEHLGLFTVEGTELRAARLMETAIGLHAVQTLAGHLRLLPERDPHRALHDALVVILDDGHSPLLVGELMIRFELALLDDLGFGLDLARCAATGTAENLVYVSPKSGRAVSAEAGEPYKDRLMALPAFLVDRSANDPDFADLRAGFDLSGRFLDRHVYEVRGMKAPDARHALIRAIEKAVGPADANT